jgi:hypothetical protein
MGNTTILRGDQIEGIESSQNFVKNLGERNTAGWARYNDGGSNPSRPIDGIGGTPTSGLDVTLSATNPLAGDKSFVFSKPASNCQGQGFSYDFAIDRASRAKVLKIEFDYLVDSGTFNAGSNTADSDLIVYLYDVDASQLIEPSTFKLYSNASNIADKFSGYFQTSATSTNYRLIFHVATTNSSSWSLKVDNVVVSPSKYVYGTPITDWVEYTPQLLGSITNPTIGPDGIVTGRWRRIGDSVEVQAFAGRGTSGGSNGSGLYYLTLPQGMVADLTKIPSRNNVGTGHVFDGLVNNYTGTAVIASDGFKISVVTDQYPDSIRDNTPSAGWWTSPGYQAFAINATIPIQGWSSSVRMSDGYEGREIAASYSSGGGDTLFNSAYTFLDFANKNYDLTNSAVGVGNGSSTNWQNTWRYIVPASGRYSVKAAAYIILPTNTPADTLIAIVINGTSFTRGARNAYITQGGGEVRSVIVAADLDLKAGDAISISVYQDSGANRTVEGKMVSIHRISSPQTIAMGEVVAGYAKNASGQSIPTNADTALTNWTVVSDTHAIFNPTTGVLTVNRSGFIDLSLLVSFQPNGTGIRSCHILKNNTQFIATYDATPHSTFNVSVTSNVAAHPVKAGDTFAFRVWQNSGSPLNIIDGTLDKTIVSWRIY